ncbi:hypothetical protein J2Z60_001805 [Lactobacillus colini]|uniref:Phage protein n=1 Tax=Lactobacillus colini TaxID=1819254 RepID=A0ABS4MFZ6_9LACO|nr:hypothetical protein [Lactobacillus colini]MBP2058617.1 hypothetical protein [Lactobacillus colini]
MNNTQEFKDVYDAVFNWYYNKETKKIEPPMLRLSIPSYVRDRLDWITEEAMVNPALSFKGMVMMMLNTHAPEKKLKEEWEFGANSDYMPMSQEYKDWISDPILHDFREMFITTALIYGYKDRD